MSEVCVAKQGGGWEGGDCISALENEKTQVGGDAKKTSTRDTIVPL